MSTAEGYGPKVIEAIDAAWLRGDVDELMEFARRAAILCATYLADGDQEMATAFATTYKQLLAMSADATMRGVKE